MILETNGKLNHYENRMMKDVDGVNNTCYRTKDGDVFKSFDEGTTEEQHSIFEYLVGFKSDFVAFPKELIYLGKKSAECFRGYTMKYIGGSVLYKINGKENFKLFINATDRLEKEIKRLSEQGLLMNDINMGNLIYDNGLLSIIDTDLYDPTPYDIYETYKDNIKELGNTFDSTFLRGVEFKSELLRKYRDLCTYEGKMKPSILLSEIISEIEKESGEEVVTFNDFETKLKLLK